MRISLEELPILTGYAQKTIGISPCAVDGDYSLSAFLRAMVIFGGDVNLTDYESLKKIGEQSLFARTQISGTSVATSIKDVFNSHGYYGATPLVLAEVKLPENEEKAKTSLSIKQLFDVDTPDGWVSLDAPRDINGHLSVVARTQVFINSEQRRTIAFVGKRVTHRWVQEFESIAFRTMPWNFKFDEDGHPEPGVTEFARTMTVSNRKLTDEQKRAYFIEFIKRAEATVDFRGMSSKAMLASYASSAKKRAISYEESSVNSLLRDIETYTSRLEELYTSRDEHVVRLNALRTSEDANSSEMVNFFDNHKNISILSADDRLIYGVTDILEFYDEDEYKRIRKTRTSYINQTDKPTLNALDAIFADHKALIKVKAVFKMQDTSLVSSIKSSYDNGSYYNTLGDAMPNPHIYFYGCDGGNGTYYSKYAKTGEWQLAIEQSISATKNINFGDSTVVNRMIDYLQTYNTIPFLYVKEDLSPVDDYTEPGVIMMTFKDFVEKINANEAKENNNG